VPGKNVRVYTHKGGEAGRYSFDSETPIWKTKNDEVDFSSPRQLLFKHPSSRA
jgi:hypothetical protein